MISAKVFSGDTFGKYLAGLRFFFFLSFQNDSRVVKNTFIFIEHLILKGARGQGGKGARVQWCRGARAHWCRGASVHNCAELYTIVYNCLQFV